MKGKGLLFAKRKVFVCVCVFLYEMASQRKIQCVCVCLVYNYDYVHFVYVDISFVRVLSIFRVSMVWFCSKTTKNGTL